MADRSETRTRRGAVKFVLLHHDCCPRGDFHYRIEAGGEVTRLLGENMRGQHPNSIGVVLSGNFDPQPPAARQIAGLEKVLLELKLRYPDAVLGAHRQVRGDVETSCPGRRFPMRALLDWSQTELVRLRDEKLNRDVESQYRS